MHIYNTLHAFFFFFFSFFHKKIVFRSEDSEEAKELTQLDDAVDKEEVLNSTQLTRFASTKVQKLTQMLTGRCVSLS